MLYLYSWPQIGILIVSNVTLVQNTESAEVHSCSLFLTVSPDLVYIDKQEGQVLYLPNHYFRESKNGVDFGSTEPPITIPKLCSMNSATTINAPTLHVLHVLQSAMMNEENDKIILIKPKTPQGLWPKL